MDLNVMIQDEVFSTERNCIRIARERLDIVLHMIGVIIFLRVVCQTECRAFCLHRIDVTYIRTIIEDRTAL